MLSPTARQPKSNRERDRSTNAINELLRTALRLDWDALSLVADAKASGALHAMQATVTSGRCNSCHVAGSRIKID